ncbi:MAG: hypothetical protein NVS4B7_00290 [Ktedonobacteraceae bacterium]
MNTDNNTNNEPAASVDASDEEAWQQLSTSEQALTEWQQQHSPAEHKEMSQKLTANADNHCYNDQHEDAIALYKRAIMLDSNNASAYLGMGNSLMALGHTKAGREAYVQAIKIDPQSVKNLPDVEEIVRDTRGE